MLIGVAAFLLLLIGLLAIPVTLSFQVTRRTTFQEDIRLHWAFGLVRVRIPIVQSRKEPALADDVERRTEGTESASGKKVRVLGALRQRRFRRRIVKFVRDLWRAIDKRNIRLRVRLGLGDPAETGRLWAVLGPMAGMLSTVREASISLEPEFFDSTFELDTSGRITLVPLRVLVLIVALLLSPIVWQGIRRMRTAR